MDFRQLDLDLDHNRQTPMDGDFDDKMLTNLDGMYSRFTLQGSDGCLCTGQRLRVRNPTAKLVDYTSGNCILYSRVSPQNCV